MKRIIYAGTEVTTGDEIAHTLLRLSEILAQLGSAQTVDIPVLSPDGSRGTASILVGPASQIVALDAGGDVDELVDVEALNALNDRITSLDAVGGEGDDSPQPSNWVDDL